MRAMIEEKEEVIEMKNISNIIFSLSHNLTILGLPHHLPSSTKFKKLGTFSILGWWEREKIFLISHNLPSHLPSHHPFSSLYNFIYMYMCFNFLAPCHQRSDLSSLSSHNHISSFLPYGRRGGLKYVIKWEEERRERW